MAFATSTQWTEVFRETIGGFAASDILSKGPVGIASGADWNFVPLATSGLEPLGIARDDAARGKAVTVYDGPGSIIRVIAGATTTIRADVGVSGVTSMLHPVSGTGATMSLYGPVTGASGTSIYRIGVAVEFANPGQRFALRVNPKQLSGLVGAL